MRFVARLLTGLASVLCLAQASVAQRALTDSIPTLGGVVTTADGQPVAQADVGLLGLGAARTDSLGRFGFRDVPAGTWLLRVQRLGFDPIMQSVVFDGVHSQRLVIRFGTTTAMLAPVVVRDSAAPARDPTGFELRRRNGQGIYLTERDIEQRRAGRVEHLLGQLPGVRVDTSGVAFVDRGRISLYNNDCFDGMQLFIDGVAVSNSYTLRNLSTSGIRGIEVYRGVASTPVELRSPRMVCGTVAIWTK
jgi:hypothetical protein